MYIDVLHTCIVPNRYIGVVGPKSINQDILSYSKEKGSSLFFKNKLRINCQKSFTPV